MRDVNVQKRITAIRAKLQEKKGGCLVVTKPGNVTYVTGFTGDDSWAVITSRAIYLITDSRYTEQAASECSACKIIERKGPMAKAAAQLPAGRRTAGRILVESTTSVAEFKALRKNVKQRIMAVSNVIESVRSIKDAGEVGRIRSAIRIAAKALEYVRRQMRRGITENELAGALDFEIRRLGGQASFETIVAFGANGSRPHHRCGNRKLRKNDTILIDFGVRYKGYCCDLTRCLVVGKTGSLYEKAYGAAKEAQAAAISKARAGVKVSEVDAAAKEVIRGYGLPVYGHGTGHGLGLEVHELPVVSASVEARLEAGQVVTIEPGVYIPGKLGVRIEDDILVTETGCRVLSSDCGHRGG